MSGVAAAPGSFSVPDDACDCHAHIFGPFSKFPLSETRGFTPTEATADDYQAELAKLGFGRAVIVQPSPFGADNACTLAAVRAIGLERCRAVVTVGEDVTNDEIGRLHEQGARAIRFNVLNASGIDFAQVERLAKRIAPQGWHVEIFLGKGMLAEAIPWISALPVPVVIDHMGSLTPADVDGPLFTAVLRLLDSGRFWIKLTHRASTAGWPFDDAQVLARRFLAEAPERCVFGSDWPHPRMDRPPGAADLLRLLADWCGEDGHRLLSTNPRRLYGF